MKCNRHGSNAVMSNQAINGLIQIEFVVEIYNIYEHGLLGIRTRSMSVLPIGLLH